MLQLKDIGSAAIGSSQLGIYAVGMLVAAVVGYICIKTMLVIVKKKKIYIFFHILSGSRYSFYYRIFCDSVEYRLWESVALS